MLIPSVKVVFEGPSKEYYTRLKTVVASRMTGCARLVFSDFEGTIFYHDGRTITALQESGMWMMLGSEMIAPLENKAVATTGTMAIYELTPAIVALFEGRKIGTVVETELNSTLNAGALLENLRSSASTCILKFRGQSWTGYVFLDSGKVAGASYVSDKDRHYGDKAMAAITKATGKSVAAMYFLEGGAPVAEVAPPEPAKPAVKQAEPVKPQEVVKTPVVPAKPAEAAKPVEAKQKPVQAPAKPAEAAKPVVKPKAVPAPAPAPAVPVMPVTAGARQAELKVATSDSANLMHQSRIATLEALETRKIAWVDASVLEELHVKESDLISLILPGNKTEKVTVAKVDVLPGTSRILILPKKLRRRLSVKPGSQVTIKP